MAAPEPTLGAIRQEVQRMGGTRGEDGCLDVSERWLNCKQMRVSTKRKSKGWVRGSQKEAENEKNSYEENIGWAQLCSPALAGGEKSNVQSNWMLPRG